MRQVRWAKEIESTGSIRIDHLDCVGDFDDKLPIALCVVVDADLDKDVVEHIPKEHMVGEESGEL